MTRFATQTWLRVTLWALLAVFLLDWIMGTARPEWPLLLIDCAFLAYVLKTRDQLPDRVASHFRFDLQPDGWLSRQAYLIFIIGSATGLSLLLLVLSFVLRGGNTDFMATHLIRFDCMFVCLFAGIHALVVQANRNSAARRLSKMFWVLLAGFQTMIVLWVITIVTHTRWGWPK